MDEEIYEKLNKIELLEDKVLLKDILNGVFTKLKEYSDARISDLEDRVFNEVDYKLVRYNIYTSIIKKESIDNSNSFFYPMIKEDVTEDIEFDVNEITKSISEKEPIKLFSIFLKCSYLEYRDFLSKNFQFKGNIVTDKRIHEAYFAVEKNDDYKVCIERLYQSFLNNNIAWSSINNPYINKLANVYLIDIKDTIESDEDILKINVDFGEYDEFIYYNMVPVWNVKEINLKGNGFPMPCEDRIYYEHNISLTKPGVENGYLIQSSDVDISDIMFKEDSIIVTAREYSPLKWQLIEIVSPNSDMVRPYEFEVVSNAINISFSNSLLFKNRHQIKTKSELSRLINSYRAGSGLKFCDIKIQDYDANIIPESYEANEFIKDEIRMENLKKRMVLYFQPISKYDYLNYDNLSFIVSEVQGIFPEYKCEGRLI